MVLLATFWATSCARAFRAAHRGVYAVLDVVVRAELREVLVLGLVFLLFDVVEVMDVVFVVIMFRAVVHPPRTDVAIRSCLACPRMSIHWV